MNTARVSGRVQGAPELRVTRDGRRILNFEIAVDGPGPREPYVPIGYILAPGETLDLKAGEKIIAIGPLRHHRSRGLFVAAGEVKILEHGPEVQRNRGNAVAGIDESGAARAIAAR